MKPVVAVEAPVPPLATATVPDSPEAATALQEVAVPLVVRNLPELPV